MTTFGDLRDGELFRFLGKTGVCVKLYGDWYASADRRAVKFTTSAATRVERVA